MQRAGGTGSCICGVAQPNRPSMGRKKSRLRSYGNQPVGLCKLSVFCFQEMRKPSVKQRVPGRFSPRADSADPTARRKPTPVETKVAAEERRNRKISAFGEKGEEIPVYPLGAPQTFGLQCIC